MDAAGSRCLDENGREKVQICPELYFYKGIFYPSVAISVHFSSVECHRTMYTLFHCAGQVLMRSGRKKCCLLKLQDDISCLPDNSSTIYIFTLDCVVQGVV